MRIKDAFCGLPQIAQHVPPIRDLHRLPRSLGDAACVLGRAVTAHDLNLRLLV